MCQTNRLVIERVINMIYNAFIWRKMYKMIVERIGILLVSIILIVMLCIKYINRYNPQNIIFISIITFIDSIYIYLTIYNVFTFWYINFIIYFFNIIIPFLLVLLQ